MGSCSISVTGELPYLKYRGLEPGILTALKVSEFLTPQFPRITLSKGVRRSGSSLNDLPEDLGRIYHASCEEPILLFDEDLHRFVSYQGPGLKISPIPGSHGHSGCLQVKSN